MVSSSISDVTTLQESEFTSGCRRREGTGSSRPHGCGGGEDGGSIHAAGCCAQLC